MKKRIISIVLAVVTVFTMTALPAGAANLRKTNPTNLITDGSYAMPDLGNIVVRIYQVNKFLYTVTGLHCFSDKALGVTLDSTMQSIVDNILLKTGVDFSKIYNYLPEYNYYPETITTVLHIDIPEFQARLREASNKLADEGNMVLSFLVNSLCVWFGIMQNCQIGCQPIEGSDRLYEIAAEVTYKDGRQETFYPGIIYDAENNLFIGHNGEPAVFGFSMDLNQMMTFTGIDVWQRNMGFCLFYDVFCYLTPAIMHYTTERIKFNYDDRGWMIQIWKGRYFITNGGEIGIYNRPQKCVGSVYNCAGDDDMLVMSMELYHGDDLLLYRDPIRHWWVTGFSVSDTAYLPNTLTLKGSITFDEPEMMDAFLASLKKKRNIDYTVDNLTVSFVW